MTDPAPVRCRELLLQAALLIIPLVALFPAVFVQGEVLVPGGLVFDTPPWSAYTPDAFEPTENKLTLDALVAFHMYYALSKRAMEAGEWPLWNRYEFAGIPLLANYQTALFYPTRILHMLMDVPWATTLFILINVWLCGFNAFLCARAIGLAAYAARFFSFGWMLCSFCAIWVYWPVNTVAAWTPIVFLGAEWILGGRYRKGFYALSLGATLMLLAGHPESAFAVGINFGLYFVLRLAWMRPRPADLLRVLWTAGGGWALAILVCAVQLLPFVEYLMHSHHFMERPGGDSAEHAVPIGSVINFFVPRFYGVTAEGTFWGNQYHSNFTNLVYPGVLAWLGVCLLVRSKGLESAQRQRIICLAIPMLLSGLASFDAPGIRPVLQLPVFSSMWYLWHVGAAVFGLQLIAAHGIHNWFAAQHKWKDLASIVAPIFVVAGIVGYAYSFHAPVLRMEETLDEVRREIYIAGIVALTGIVLVSMAAPKRHWIAALLTVLLAADLVGAVRNIHPTSPRSHIFFKTPTTDWMLDQKEPYRSTIVTAAIPSGFFPAYGIEQTIAYDGILPMRFYRLFSQLGEDFWRRMMAPLGVKYVVHDPRNTPYINDYSPEDFTLAAAMDDLEIWEYGKAFPRAWLVDRFRVIESPDAMLDAIRDDKFDPRHTALVEAEVPGGALEASGLEIGSVGVVSRTENSVTLEVDTARDAVLILSDAYYPGWRAEVDGEDVAIFPVFSVVRGIRVPAGTQKAVFYYYPASFRIGLFTSSLILICSAAVSVRLLRRNRKARS